MLALLAAALPAQAQKAQKVLRVAFVMSTAPVSVALSANSPSQSLVQALHALGYVQGKNLAIEWRSAEGRYERLPEIMRELLSRKPDVIVTGSNPVTRAAKEATRTVPIVMLTSFSPAEEGLVQSLARPGGNVTGVAVDTGPENIAKRVQILKEIFPRLKRVAYLGSKEGWAQWKGSIERAGEAMGVKILLVAHTPTDYADAFAVISRERPDALLIAPNAPNFVNRQLIIDFAAQNRLPAIYPMRDFAEGGGLIAQGVDLAEISRRAAGYIDRILKGAKPSELPVELPAKYELVINLKTAKTLGVSIPQSVLVRADHIIQ